MTQIQPVKISGFVPPHLLQKLQLISRGVRQGSINHTEDRVVYFRKFLKNHPVTNVIHRSYVLPLAEKVFGEKLSPTYSYLSIYEKGKGNCPIHVDKSECYRTVDICLDQNFPWPIHVVPNLTREVDNTFVKANEADLKKNGTQFDLVPGDALFLSGTHHPHWRDPIDNDNFCDLVFFHFVPWRDG